MTKWCFNYESGQYEDIDEDGFSWTQHRYVLNWDDSEYVWEKRRKEEEERRRNSYIWDDDEDNFLF